jgi:hypothetical protein
MAGESRVFGAAMPISFAAPSSPPPAAGQMPGARQRKKKKYMGDSDEK